MDTLPIQSAPTVEIVLSAEQAACAWCLAEAGIPAGEVSHGICKKCAARFLVQWQERVERHQGGATWNDGLL